MAARSPVATGLLRVPGSGTLYAYLARRLDGSLRSQEIVDPVVIKEWLGKYQDLDLTHPDGRREALELIRDASFTALHQSHMARSNDPQSRRRMLALEIGLALQMTTHELVLDGLRAV